MNAFEAFAKVQQTYNEAEEKAKQEAGAPKVERFRIGEDGEFAVRVLPLAPVFDENGNILPMERKGYEYGVHQFFLEITTPSKKGGKPKKINIPVIRTTDKEVGYSVDLIDTYVKIAKEIYGDDEDLMKLIGNNGYMKGLRWNYQHAMMVLDLSSEKSRAKGPQIWQCSHSQYKDIDAAKMRLWKELREGGDKQETCPISWFNDAYPVKIIRKTEKNKTEYTFELGRKTVDVTEEEATKLLELPRIPEQIYRYTRYQFEATVEFLRQYDAAHDMEVCQEPDFKEAIDKLSGELPADDKSHFDIAGVASKENENDDVTIDTLWREYDFIIDQDLSEKSDEYQELREKIRQYIEDNNIDVRISRSKNNQQILEEIDEYLREQKNKTAEKEPAKVESEAEEDSKDEEKPLEEPESAPVRRRRARPGSEDAKDEESETASNTMKEVADTPVEESEKPAEEVEQPRRRRRLR